LSPEQKHATEVLLGHPVSDDEAVSVKSLNPSSIIPSSLSAEERITAMRALGERCPASQMPAVSEDEEEGLVREAFRSTTRPDYRPVR
jgi:hypothetical protein